MAENLRKEFPTTYALFDKYGAQVVAEMRTRLFNNGSIASETLYDSLDYDIAVVGRELDLGFIMEDYGDFVDKGRNGKLKKWRSDGSSNPKFPPIGALKEWVRLKGIDADAVYPIQRKIGLFGIAPTNFYTISTTRRQKQFLKNMQAAIAEDLKLEINK